jgi:hypothetical protein
VARIFLSDMRLFSVSWLCAAAFAAGPVVTKTTIPSPFLGPLNACAQSLPGAALGASTYFFPAPGANATAITVFNMSALSWSQILLPPGALPHIQGAAFAAVGDAAPASGGAGGTLFVGGGTGPKGQTGATWAHHLANASWEALPPMAPATWNLCAVGCNGGVYAATGSCVRAADAPANRQIYRFNISAGTKLENNMKKQRARASCVCGSNFTFWAGGQDDSGLTNSVEIWQADPACPLCRGGMPVWSLDSAREGVGGAACGGFVAFAGGDDGKGLVKSVELFTDNGTDPTGRKVGFFFFLLGGGVLLDSQCTKGRLSGRSSSLPSPPSRR